MAIRKADLTEEMKQKVLELAAGPDCPTNQTMAEKLNTSSHTIGWILRSLMSPSEYKALKGIRYGRSKTGVQSPHYGKPSRAKETNDGYGYLTLLRNGKREFVHRIVMAKALGLKTLPRLFEVHHINEDAKDNRLDNLALTTSRGHRAIHLFQHPDSKIFASRKLSAWEVYQSLTSQSEKMKATKLE